MQAFGKQIEVRELNIGEVMKYQNKDMTDFDNILDVVSDVSGIDKDTIKNMPAKHLDDVNKIISYAFGTDEAEAETKKK